MKGPFFELIVSADVPILSYFSESEKEKEFLFLFTEAFIEFLHLLEKNHGGVHIKIVLPPAYYFLVDQWEFKQKMEQFLQKSKQVQVLLPLWKKWRGNLIGVLSKRVKNGNLELLGLPAMEISLPCLPSLEEVERQIQLGREILVELFHVEPRGFFLPKGTYVSGMDMVIKKASYQYSYINETPIISKGEPVESPNCMTFFSINKTLSNMFIQDDCGVNSFMQELKKKRTGRADTKSCTINAILVDLQSFLKSNEVLKKVSCLIDEGFLIPKYTHHASTQASEAFFIHDRLEMNVRKLPQKTKILILAWEFPPNVIGGLARHVHGLTKSLGKKGYAVHVITAGKEELPAEEKRDGVVVHRVKPLHENEMDFLKWIGGLNIAMIEKAAMLAEIHQFHCLHAHDWLVGAAASVLKKQLDIPLAVTIHATEYGRNNGIYTEMQRFIHEQERKLVEAAEKIIVCSSYMKEEIQKLFDVPVEKIVTIANGVDHNHRVRGGRQDLLAGIPIDCNRKLIFSMGRMVTEKGFDTLIKAAGVLKKKGVPVYFIIAGKGPMLEEYRRDVKKANLEDSVFFIGFVNDDIRDALLEICDMAVFPSLYEPFGIVALESMKAGKPTIVSNTGGLKGLVQHLKTGLLMVPGNTESLLQQMMFLLNNPNRAKELGVQGKQLVERVYNWDMVAEETRRVYEKINKSGRPEINKTKI